MKGIPRHLNTRADYAYVRAHLTPEHWRPDWQQLLDSRFVWQTVAELQPGEPGIDDATHRVLIETDEHDQPLRFQQEFMEDPTAKIFRLGMTVPEVIAALEQA